MPTTPYAAFRNRLIFSVSLLIGLLAALMAWKVYSDIQSNREAAFKQTQSFARAMAAHIESVTRVIDLSLQRSAEGLGSLDPEALRNPRRAHQILALSAGSLNAGFWLHFVDARGVGVSASNGLAVGGVSYADRLYFTLPRRDRTAGLYVSAPEVGRVSKRRIFFMSRGVFAPDGAFLGVVVASVDAAAIADVFSNALYQPTLSITLMHGGGKIVARAPLFERSFASDLSASELYRRWKAAPSGSYEGRSLVDGSAACSRIKRSARRTWWWPWALRRSRGRAAFPATLPSRWPRSPSLLSRSCSAAGSRCAASCG